MAPNDDKQTRIEGSSDVADGRAKQLAEDRKARDRIATFVSAVAVSLITVAGLLSVIGLPTTTHLDVDAARTYFDSIAKTQKDVEDLKTSLRALQRVPETATDASAIGPTQSIDRIDARLRRLEDALSTTPDKALALPLLRSELAAYKEQHLRDVAGINAEVSRVYDMNKWVVGLIGAAVLGLAVNNVLGRTG